MQLDQRDQMRFRACLEQILSHVRVAQHHATNDNLEGVKAQLDRLCLVLTPPKISYWESEEILRSEAAKVMEKDKGCNVLSFERKPAEAVDSAEAGESL